MMVDWLLELKAEPGEKLCWNSLRCVVPRIISGVLFFQVLLVMFVLLGAVPNQIDRPPQPFFQDFFSGKVTLQGGAPPAGALLIACIDDCDTVFQSRPYNLNTDGSFDQLEVNPKRKELVGHPITFYLVNDFGKIASVEVRPYIGVFDFYVQDLSFTDSMPHPSPLPSPTLLPEPTPEPTPTASLPIAGDPAVTILPKIILASGGIAVLFGSVLLFASRRKEV
jgi:hypothetical protein